MLSTPNTWQFFIQSLEIVRKQSDYSNLVCKYKIVDRIFCINIRLFELLLVIFRQFCSTHQSIFGCFHLKFKIFGLLRCTDIFFCNSTMSCITCECFLQKFLLVELWKKIFAGWTGKYFPSYCFFLANQSQKFLLWNRKAVSRQFWVFFKCWVFLWEKFGESVESIFWWFFKNF